MIWRRKKLSSDEDKGKKENKENNNYFMNTKETNYEIKCTVENEEACSHLRHCTGLWQVGVSQPILLQRRALPGEQGHD